MSKLPENWSRTALSEIASIKMGQSPGSHSYNDIGEGLPFFQGKAEFGKIYPTATRWTSNPIRIADVDDILLSVRAPVGPTNLATEKCCIGRGLAAIQSDVLFNQRYLFYYFRSIGPWLSQQGTGSTFAGINSRFIHNLEVPVAPIAEQKRIADKLDVLSERIDACQARLARVRRMLDRYRKVVLTAAISGELTEDWDTKQQKWLTCPLSSMLTDIRYGTAKKSLAELKDGTPVLRIPNIKDGQIDPSDLKYGSFSENELKTFALKTDDLLMIRSNGSLGLVGKVAVVEPEFEGYLFAGYLIRLRLNLGMVNPNYLSLYLSSPKIRRQIESTARTTVGINNINSKDIRNIQIELPPIDEQKEIVRRAEALFTCADCIETRYQAAQTQVEKLTPLILSKAFRGELVPQDPNDEPASVLLERIRAERAAKPKTSKKVSTRKTPKRTKMTEKSVKAVIDQLPTDTFTFDELRGEVAGDYETLQKFVFDLLDEPEPSISQVFDKDSESMRFVRSEK
jgi:type I restriction enzyme, S subunit